MIDIAAVVEAIELIVSSPQGLLICLLITVYVFWDMATRKDAIIREQDRQFEKVLMDELAKYHERERRCYERNAERRAVDDTDTKTHDDGKPVSVADLDARRRRDTIKNTGGDKE